MQCQNFERGDNSAASASNSVVPSIQLSPKRNPPKSPELGREIEGEIKTSPYFKNNNSQQIPQEIHSKAVVRTIDLGSLSSKLSGRCDKMTHTDYKPTPAYPETDKDLQDTLGSSQKENVDETKDCVTEIDLASTNKSPKAVTTNCKGFEPETVQRMLTPKLHSSSSKLTKRKQETVSTGKVTCVLKKAKYEGSSREQEDVHSGETSEKTHMDQPNAEKPSTTSCDPLRSDETEQSATVLNGSLPEINTEPNTSDESVDGSHPPWLPYYLRNFRTVLQAVLENEDDRALFNQDDMSFVHTFEKLSGMQDHSFILDKGSL